MGPTEARGGKRGGCRSLSPVIASYWAIGADGVSRITRRRGTFPTRGTKPKIKDDNTENNFKKANKSFAAEFESRRLSPPPYIIRNAAEEANIIAVSCLRSLASVAANPSRPSRPKSQREFVEVSSVAFLHPRSDHQFTYFHCLFVLLCYDHSGSSPWVSISSWKMNVFDLYQIFTSCQCLMENGSILGFLIVYVIDWPS